MRHGWHLWMTFMDDFIGWLSWMTFMDDCHGFYILLSYRQTDRRMDLHWYLLSCYCYWKCKNTENWYGNLRILTNSESIGNISYIHFQSLALLILWYELTFVKTSLLNVYITKIKNLCVLLLKGWSFGGLESIFLISKANVLIF